MLKRKTAKILLFGSLLAIILIIFPSPSSAFLDVNLSEIAGNIIVTIVAIFIGAIFQAIALIGITFLGIANTVLQWVIGPNFISLSYTNPTNNPLIEAGWGLTRNLANMGIVLALIYIGIATALRVTGFEYKKSFFRLLLVALLINFTPLYCGIIVDASNILMNYFLHSVSGFGQLTNLINNIESSLNFNPNSLNSIRDIAENFMFNAIGITVYSFAAAFILFIYAFLFIIRYVAIWTLVIVSPIAFLFYILPNIRVYSYFEKWWEQFLQWSFIGVILGFFLWLSNYLMGITAQGKLMKDIEKGGLLGAIGSLVPYSFALVLLFIGIEEGMSSSAMGASIVLSRAKHYGRKSTEWMKEKGWKRTKSEMARTVTKIAPRLRQERISKEDLMKKSGRERLGYAFRRGVNLMAKPLIGLSPYALQARKKEIANAEKLAEGILDPSLYRKKLTSKFITQAEKIGLLNWGIKKGGAFKKVAEEINPEESAALAKEANEIGASAQAGTIARNIVGKINLEKAGFQLTDKDKQKGYYSIEDKIIKETQGDNLKQFSSGFWESQVGKRAMKDLSGAQLSKLAQIHGPNFVNNYNNTNVDVDYLLQKNPSALLYLSGNAAQDAGYTSPGNLDRKDVRNLLAKFRKGKYMPDTIFAPPKVSPSDNKTNRQKNNRKDNKPPEVGAGI